MEREGAGMNDNDRRNAEDFYAHRALVLRRIEAVLAKEKKAPKK